MTRSKFMRLNFRDFFRGMITAVAAAAGGVLSSSVNTGNVPDLHTIKLAGTAGALALFGYLTTNLFTNSQGKLKGEN